MTRTLMSVQHERARRTHMELSGWEECLLEPAATEDCCLICYDVMVRPTFGCSNRGHACCEECYMDYLKTGGGVAPCPAGCGKRVDGDMLEMAIERHERIRKLPSKCKHASLGCDWLGRFGLLVEGGPNRISLTACSHISECPYEPIPCPYAALGCREVCRRREMEAHIQRAALAHVELTGASISGLTQTVSSLTRAVANLEEQVEIQRLRQSGAPELIELQWVDRASQPQPDAGTYLGMYKLDDAERINGRPLYVHCEDGRFCIAYHDESSTWHAQLRDEAGEARGFHTCRETYPSLFPCEAQCWTSYTGNVHTGVHSWQKGATRCVVWSTAAAPAQRTVAMNVELRGHVPTTLPPQLYREACACLGTYQRRDEQMVNGRHVYAKLDDERKMIWFVRYGTAEYTGWYVGHSGHVGQSKGNIMAPATDAALSSASLPTRWFCGTGSKSPFVRAPGLAMSAPGELGHRLPHARDAVGEPSAAGSSGDAGVVEAAARAAGSPANGAPARGAEKKRRRSPRGHGGSL